MKKITVYLENEQYEYTAEGVSAGYDCNPFTSIFVHETLTGTRITGGLFSRKLEEYTYKQKKPIALFQTSLVRHVEIREE